MFQPDKLAELIETPVLVPGSFDHFSDWVARHDPDAEYCWMDNGVCLFGQYGKYCGHTGKRPYTHAMNLFHQAATYWPLLKAGVACEKPHTFGEALKRIQIAKAK